MPAKTIVSLGKSAQLIGIIITALIFVGGCTPPLLITDSGEMVARENMTVKKFILLTEDGIGISASHFLSGKPDVCILAHGFMGSKQRPYITKLAQTLSKHFDVMTFDFRGHGKSGGVSNGAEEFYDIKAVIDYAKSQGYEKIALVGFSLGGIQGIYVAARFHDVDALVTVGTPADAKSIVPNAGWLFWMANNPLGRLVLRIWVRLGDAPEFPKPVTVIEQVSPVPILIVHGSNDTLVDVKEAELLYQKAKEPKELVIIEGMDHPPKLPSEFYDTVENWLIELLKQ